MYFPIGWPSILNSKVGDDDELLTLKFNRTRTLFAVISCRRVFLWKTKPRLLLATWQKDSETFRDTGTIADFVWKPDSLALCLSTSHGKLLFLSVTLSEQKLYNLQYQGSNNLEQLNGGGVSKYALQFISSTSLGEAITSLSARPEDIVVSTTGGWLERVSWNGNVDLTLSFDLTKVPFSVDLETTRSSFLEGKNLYAVDVETSLPLAGFAFVLCDGRGGFLASSSASVELAGVIGLLAKDLRDATCVAINHRYQLIAFGCENSQALAYCFDDLTGGLVLSHKFALPVRDFPDLGKKAGPVKAISWSPDGCCLCLLWQNGGMGVWSVFGSLLACSLSDNVSFDKSFFHSNPLQFCAMDWSLDGYSLLLIPNTSKENNKISLVSGDVICLSFVKSVLTVNPCMPNHQHLILQADDCIHFNTGDMLLHQSTNAGIGEFADGQLNATHNAMSPSMLFSNRHWQTIQVPSSYIASNWPIRYTAVDSTGNFIAIAGKTGYAHFSFPSRKWKLFGSERQEKSVSCRGGLTWWDEFLLVACHFNETDTSEVVFHHRKCKLDVDSAQRILASAPIVCINTFSNVLLVYSVDCQVVLYKLDINYQQPNKATLLTTKISETSLVDYVPHPLSVVSVFLTSLRNEPGTTDDTPSHREAHSMIINVGGKVLMLQKEKSQCESNSRNSKITFHAPVILASCVENAWYMMATSANSKRHFSESLWLACGSAGMKAWIPLFPTQDGSKKLNFLSKRIMLHFSLSVYPLAVLFEDAIILGVNSDEGSATSSQSSLQRTVFPFYTLERTTQVFLPHILRQLLRRNLGVHALSIASCCTNLPYFTHVLELMLHEVLEKEATASEPIPDPLLPRVVAFVQEFPQYLETVCHCARKTEVALWSHLFSVVGNPLTLFKECLQLSKLDTAATYLIILQNLAHPSVSRQNATLLLEAALDEDNWKLCKDLVRFLRAIGKGDLDSPPRTPVHVKSYHPPSLHSASSVTADESGGSTASLPMKLSRAGSLTRPSTISPASAGMKEQRQRPSALKLSRTASLDKFSSVSPARPVTVESCEQFYTDMILSRHARKLLTWLRIRDLGRFCAHVDFDMVAWFTKERFRAACVDDYIEAINVIHRQFNWPYPVSFLPQLSHGSSARSSRQSSFRSSSSRLNSITPLTPMQELNRSMDEDRSVDAVLTVTKIADDVSSIGGGMELSECSSLSCSQDDLDRNTDSTWTSEADAGAMPQPLGSRQTEMELRYLQDVFVDARCIDWCILACLVLNDVAPLVRVIKKMNTFRDLTQDRVSKVIGQIAMLESWATEYYPSYLNVIVQVRSSCEELYSSCTNDHTVRENPAGVHDDVFANHTGEHQQWKESSASTKDDTVEEADDVPFNMKEGESTDNNYDCVIS